MPWLLSLLSLGGVKKGLFLVAALAVAGALAFQRVQLTEARNAHRAVLAELALVQQELFAARQAIAAVEAESASRLAKAAKAARRAEQVAASAEARARAVETAPAPATCEAAIELLVEGVRP